jgi:hypothetical protein
MTYTAASFEEFQASVSQVKTKGAQGDAGKYWLTRYVVSTTELTTTTLITRSMCSNGILGPVS